MTTLDLALAFGIVAAIMMFIGLRLGRYLERQLIDTYLRAVHKALSDLRSDL